MVSRNVAFAARLGLAVVLALLLLAGPGPLGANGAAAEPEKDPADFVRTFGAQATEMLADRSQTPEQRAQRFRHLFTAHFDVDAISRYTLGRYWHKANEQERADYRAVFEDFIVATYARRLEGYGALVIRVGETNALGKQGVTVDSQIVQPEGEPLPVVWRLQRRDGEWRIIDLVIEGVSLALTQRSEFTAVIKNSGGEIDMLLQRLRQMTEET